MKGKGMHLKIFDSGAASAETNMRLDLQLLQSLDASSLPTLHFYDWQLPSATYGYFCKPDLFLKTSGIERRGLQLAKRPTGGGIIFHQYDFAFSFLLPSSHPCFSLNTLDNYRLVNELIASTIQNLFNISSPLELLAHEATPESASSTQKTLRHFCMALPTVYDVIQGDQKLAGGAQRRTKQGFLHQASIALALPPDDFLAEVLRPRSGIAEAMKKSTYPLLKNIHKANELQTAKAAFKNRLIENFTDWANQNR